MFEFIVRQVPQDRRLVIVLDEFQYLASVNPALPSIFQRIVDQLLQSTQWMLILCGSLISMMYKTTLSYDSPLYGRRTAQMKIQPLDFESFALFFPQKSLKELIELYAILYGVPKYIEMFPLYKDIFTSIKNNILSKNSFLYQEPRFVLSEELSANTTYFSILQIIASGDHKLSNIASKLGVKTQNITSFMDKLRELDLIERDVPVLEDNPAKSKKGLYFIKDSFFRFWFRFVFPMSGSIETDNIIPVLTRIKRDFSHFVSFTFEKIVQEAIRKKPPFPVLKIGRYWDKNTEIDLIAVGEEDILVVHFLPSFISISSLFFSLFLIIGQGLPCKMCFLPLSSRKTRRFKLKSLLRALRG